MALFACTGVSSDLLDGQPTGSSGGSGDGGASGDARVTRGDGGRVTSDAGIVKPDSGGGHGDVVPAVCGSSLTCNSTDPTCCGIQGDGLTTTTSYSCTANGSECSSMSTAAVPIECRDNSDCSGGNICCGVLKNVSAQGGYASVRCQSSCQEKDTGGNLTANVIFCSNSDVCTADGFTCGASTLLPGFNICGND